MKTSLLILSLLFAGLLAAEEKDNPSFYCGFDSKEEISASRGIFSGRAKFIDGIKGKALDLAKGTACLFPREKCMAESEGTLLAWILPHWNLRDIKSGRLQMFRVINEEQGKNAPPHYNYFCILGHSYGNIERGIPYQLYCYVNGEENSGVTGVLLLPDASWKAETWQHIAVTWRVNTGEKDGEFAVYINGEPVGRVTDFRAEKIKFGKKLSIVPDSAVDELKIWNRILSGDEIKMEFSKYKPENKE